MSLRINDFLPSFSIMSAVAVTFFLVEFSTAEEKPYVHSARSQVTQMEEYLLEQHKKVQGGSVMLWVDLVFGHSSLAIRRCHTEVVRSLTLCKVRALALNRSLIS